MIRRDRKRAFVRAWRVVPALVLAGCTTPATEVIVDLATDAPPTRRVSIEIAVSRGDPDAMVGADRWLPLADGGSVALPASFGITPAPGMLLSGAVRLVVRVTMQSDPSQPIQTVFRIPARFSFTPHRTTRLGLFISTQCGVSATGCVDASERCTVAELCFEQGLSCLEGRCVPIDMPTDRDASVAAMDAAQDVTTDLGERAEACMRRCTGRACGPDQCGGSCGTCSASETCSSRGTCDPVGCMPDCSGRVCGPEPVCGVSCGGCPTGMECDSFGQCVCSGGQMFCGGSCVDVTANPANCGGCGHDCQGGTCSGGSCSCTGGLTSCPNGCVDLSIDSGNCGSCDHRCSSLSAPACCGGTCTSFNIDPMNCGSCGTTCTGATPMCVAAVCM